jgi:hypothetical protein
MPERAKKQDRTHRHGRMGPVSGSRFFIEHQFLATPYQDNDLDLSKTLTTGSGSLRVAASAVGTTRCGAWKANERLNTKRKVGIDRARVNFCF